MKNASRVLQGLPRGPVPVEEAVRLLKEGGPSGLALLAEDPTQVADLILDELDMHEDQEVLELCRRLPPSRGRLQHVRGNDLVRWKNYTSTLGEILQELTLTAWAGLALAYDPNLTLGTSVQQAREMAPADVTLRPVTDDGGPSPLGVLLQGVLHHVVNLDQETLQGIWVAAQTIDDSQLAAVLIVSREVPQDVLGAAERSVATIRSALVLSRQTPGRDLGRFETDTSPEVQRALRARHAWQGAPGGVGRVVPQHS